jgi:hypothetical protein
MATQNNVNLSYCLDNYYDSRLDKLEKEIKL